MFIYRFVSEKAWGFDVRKDASNLAQHPGLWTPAQLGPINTEMMSDNDWQRAGVDKLALMNDLEVKGCHICPKPDWAL